MLNNRILSVVIVMLLTVFFGAEVFAGGPPGPPIGGGGPPTGCWPPSTCIPIDGGIGFLLMAGFAYGAKKVYDNKKG